ncbi:MAG: hypothetical protein LBK66_14330 [Spirochaetaceae bacterium]|nr:hypothetical protein [Spirochaetaceae bacterium]
MAGADGRVCQLPLPYRRHGVEAASGMPARSECASIANGKSPKAGYRTENRPAANERRQDASAERMKTRWRGVDKGG